MGTKKTPWHIWVVGFLSLIWNAIGAFDYIMTMLRVENYMSQFTEEQLAYFTSFPGWLNALWALALWGGLMGSILLLFRKKLALPVFWIGLIAMIVTTIHNYVLADVKLYEITETGATIFSAVIFLVAVLLVFYSKKQVANGNLR